MKQSLKNILDATKGVVKVGAIPALTLFGAEKVFADSTSVVPTVITAPDTVVKTERESWRWQRPEEHYRGIKDVNVTRITRMVDSTLVSEPTITISTKDTLGNSVVPNSEETAFTISNFEPNEVTYDTLRGNPIKPALAQRNATSRDTSSADTSGQGRQKYMEQNIHIAEPDTLTATVVSDTSKRRDIGRNYLYTNDPFTDCQDGITLSKSGFRFDLTPETNITLEEIIQTKVGGKHYSAVESRRATRNILEYLDGDEAKEKFGKQIIAARKNNYLAKLDSISRVNILPDSAYTQSAKILTRALENNAFESMADTLFDEAGNSRVADGWYTLISRNDDESERVPIYLLVQNTKEGIVMRGEQGITGDLRGKNLNTLSGDTYTAVIPRVDSMERNLREIEKQLAEFQAKEDSLRDTTAQVVPRDTSKVDSTKTPTTKETKKGKKSLTFMVGGYAGQINGVQAGFRVGRVGVTGTYGIAPDKNVKYEPGPMSNSGMQGAFETNETGYHLFGGALEFYLTKNTFVGAGANSCRWDNEKIVAVKKPNGTVKRVSEDESMSAVSGNFYAGRRIVGGKRAYLEGVAGYDTRNGAYGGGRINFRIRK